MAPLFKGVSAKTPASSQQGSTALESLPADLRGHRSIIYDLFELYQDEVRGMNGFDLLDLVFHIWTQVCASVSCGVGCGVRNRMLHSNPICTPILSML